MGPVLQRRTGAFFWQMIVGRSSQNNRGSGCDHHRLYHRWSGWIWRWNNSSPSLGMGLWRTRGDPHISLLSGIEHRLESRTAPAGAELDGGPLFRAWGAPFLRFGQFFLCLHRYRRIGPNLRGNDALIRGLYTASDRA